jgi:hypothetical protein
MQSTKRKFVLELKHRAKETNQGKEVKLHKFLTSVLDGGEWSVSRSSSFIHKEGSAGTQYTGDWMGTRATLDAVAEKWMPCRESNSRHSVRHFTY